MDYNKEDNMLEDATMEYIKEHVEAGLMLKYQSLFPVRKDVEDYASKIAKELSTETRPIDTGKVIMAMLFWYKDNGPKSDEGLLMYVDDLVEGGN